MTRPALFLFLPVTLPLAAFAGTEALAVGSPETVPALPDGIARSGPAGFRRTLAAHRDRAGGRP